MAVSRAQQTACSSELTLSLTCFVSEVPLAAVACVLPRCGAVKLGTDTGNLGCQEDGLVFEDPTNPGSKYMIKVSLAKQEDAPPSPPVTTDTQKPGSGGLRGKVVIKVHVDGDEKMDFVNVMGAAMVAALVVACMVATIVVVVIHSRRKTQKHDNYSSLDKKSSEQPPGISG